MFNCFQTLPFNISHFLCYLSISLCTKMTLIFYKCKAKSLWVSLLYVFVHMHIWGYWSVLSPTHFSQSDQITVCFLNPFLVRAKYFLASSFVRGFYSINPHLYFFLIKTSNYLHCFPHLESKNFLLNNGDFKYIHYFPSSSFVSHILVEYNSICFSNKKWELLIIILFISKYWHRKTFWQEILPKFQPFPQCTYT